MSAFKKLVYCDFEFPKKLRSSNSHFSPFASGDAKWFWDQTVRFILKSNIQLNINTQKFSKSIKNKDGDTFFELWNLWKRSANGECEIHFLEEHQIKFAENIIATEDATQYAFLIKESTAVAQHYAKSWGVVAFSPESWTSNANAKKLGYLYRDSGCVIPKSERRTWADILRSKDNHLSDCNSLIIIDNYLLRKKTSIDKNLYPILEELLPITLDENRQFHLTIVTADKDLNRFSDIFEDLETRISERRPKLPIKIELYVENGIGSLHDRAIITNNAMVELPGGFDLIGKTDMTTKETTIRIQYPGIQSFSDICDGTYIRTIACCREIIRKIRKGCGGEYWSSYDEGEINRMLS